MCILHRRESCHVNTLAAETHRPADTGCLPQNTAHMKARVTTEDLKAIATGLANSICPGFHCTYFGASPEKPAAGAHLLQPLSGLGLKANLAQRQQENLEHL